jgi:uncharacterized membrane protein HdeD (DUF308 family)
MSASARRPRRGWIWGIVVLLCGLLAIGAPLVSGLAVTLFLGIALLVAGLGMTLFAFRAPSLSRGLLKFLFGGLTVLCGLALLAQPGLALAGLTLVLGMFFLFDGVTGLVVAWNLKPAPGWGWMTFAGGITFLLGYLMLSGWPASALWALGLLVGVRLLLAGITILTLDAGPSA